jgi:hypothetical protein
MTLIAVKMLAILGRWMWVLTCYCLIWYAEPLYEEVNSQEEVL